MEGSAQVENQATLGPYGLDISEYFGCGLPEIMGAGGGSGFVAKPNYHREFEGGRKGLATDSGAAQ